MRRIVMLFALLVTACAPFHQQQASEPPARLVVQGVQDVSPAEARELVQKGLMVIDVREPAEFANGHIPGARNLPVGQLDAWAQDLDPAGSYLLVCASGRRSTRAKQQLESRGFRSLRNMTGGMFAWEMEDYPQAR